jgi:F0F1-type ATP synthase assembly protein I
MIPVPAAVSSDGEEEVRMSEERREMFRQLAVYSHVGMTFVFSILIGFGIGWALDNKIFDGKTAPYLTFVFLGLGILAGFKSLWELTRKMKDE